jgi:hypothetical protein
MSFKKMVMLSNWEARFIIVNIDDLIITDGYCKNDIISMIENYSYYDGLSFYNSCMASMQNKESWRYILERLTTLCNIVGNDYCRVRKCIFDFLSNLQPYIIKVNEDRDEIKQQLLLEEAYKIINK